MWLFLVVSGALADEARRRKLLSTTNVRKIMNAVGQSGHCVVSICVDSVLCES